MVLTLDPRRGALCIPAHGATLSGAPELLAAAPACIVALPRKADEFSGACSAHHEILATEVWLMCAVQMRSPKNGSHCAVH